MTGKLKGKFNPDDLTPRRNLPDKSVIAPGKGIGDDVVELPYEPRKPDGSMYKYEPGKKKGKFSPKEGEDVIELPYEPRKPDGSMYKYEPGKKKGQFSPKEGKDYTLFRKGGSVKSSASKRADGIAKKGKTRGKIC